MFSKPVMGRLDSNLSFFNKHLRLIDEMYSVISDAEGLSIKIMKTKDKVHSWKNLF